MGFKKNAVVYWSFYWSPQSTKNSLFWRGFPTGRRKWRWKFCTFTLAKGKKKHIIALWPFQRPQACKQNVRNQSTTSCDCLTFCASVSMSIYSFSWGACKWGLLPIEHRMLPQLTCLPLNKQTPRLSEWRGICLQKHIQQQFISLGEPAKLTFVWSIQLA